MGCDSGDHWRYSVGCAVGAFLGTRVIVLIAALTAPQDRSRPDGPTWWSDVPLVAWDSGHYAAILEHGYPPAAAGELPTGPGSSRIAFFPGYSLVAKPLAYWLGTHVALVVTSHLAALIGMLFLYSWARKRTSPRSAFWCVLLLGVYPPAMFLSAAYADALLFMCVAIIVWLLERGRIWPAAGMSALATATRPTGLAVAAIVALWALIHGPRVRWRRRVLYVILIGAVSVSGFLAYQGYLWHHYGRPDAFLLVQYNWGTLRPVPNPVTRILTLKPVLQPAVQPLKYLVRGQFDRLFDPPTWNPTFNLLILVLAVVGLIRPGRIPRLLFLLPILVFLMAYIPDPYRGDRLVGIARYHLVALPCFLWLAEWVAWRWARVGRYVFVVLQVGLQCLYVRGFMDWEMVG